MANVIYKYIAESDKGYDNNKTVGECSECGTSVYKDRRGCDEECPKCGAWLDWDFEEEIEDIYDELDDLFR